MHPSSPDRQRLKVESARRLGDLIRTEILRGRYAAGDLLPSEAEFSDCYGVGRNVVRGALDLLRRDGYVIRRQGRGTFVVSKHRVHDLTSGGGIAREFPGRAQRVLTRFVEVLECRAERIVAERLQVPQGTCCIVATYETQVDREPYSVATSYLPRDRVAAAFDTDLEGEWLGDWFMVLSELGLSPGHLELQMEAVAADEHLAATLHVAVGAPLLRFERLLLDDRGRPLDFGFSRCRSDRVLVRAALSGSDCSDPTERARD
jgi:GntR family transcriptional regulator